MQIASGTEIYWRRLRGEKCLQLGKVPVFSASNSCDGCIIVLA